MSYKSLLFCSDERTARLVTQVLNELEFTVEPASDPYAAVKKLSDEHFDALVVDCENEQDATLLFKTARDSSHNHSSLSVAVVEGQAGVARAFRIGANLVLTKPINIEQSKGTLRVARGLLRKNETKPSSMPAPSKTSSQAAAPWPAPVAAPSAESISRASDPLKPVTTPAAPFAALELDTDPTPEPEAAEAAVLESLPQLSRHAADSMSPVARPEAEPIAANSSGQAAAVAPALEKAEMAIALKPLKPETMPPMVTNEPIVPDAQFAIHADMERAAPAFSSLELAARPSGGMKFFKAAVILSLAITAVYFGWQKLQPMQYLQRIRAEHVTTTSTAPVQAPVPSIESTPTRPSPVVESPKAVPAEDEISASETKSSHSEKLDTIEVQELPMSSGTKPASPPKAQPLIVKPDTGVKSQLKSTPLPPTVQLSPANPSDSSIAKLATTTPSIPKLAPTSLRVSQGVSQGLLLKKIAPQYPPMALRMHKEGAVEMLVTITKQGLITDVRVLSGDSIFAKPAVDAVRQWKYRPYLLNGEPVDIQTQITMIFKAPH